MKSLTFSGESGLVYKAYLNTPLGKELVAVKTGKGIYKIIIYIYNIYLLSLALFTQTDMERLAKEVSTMLSFEHRNIMSLVGVCIDGEMPLLIMPFMSNGSILEFVKHHKEKFLCRSNSAAMVYLPFFFVT